MKTKLISIISLVALTLTILASCTVPTGDNASVWDNATYSEDTALGTGDTTFTLVVEAESKTVTFTVSTNEENVGAALLSLNLIAGEDSAYGLYVKTVNGILADYDIDGSYWAFYIDGDYAMTGVDSTVAVSGSSYALKREK